MTSDPHDVSAEGFVGELLGLLCDGQQLRISQNPGAQGQIELMVYSDSSDPSARVCVRRVPVETVMEARFPGVLLADELRQLRRASRSVKPD